MDLVFKFDGETWRIPNHLIKLGSWEHRLRDAFEYYKFDAVEWGDKRYERVEDQCGKS